MFWVFFKVFNQQLFRLNLINILIKCKIKLLIKPLRKVLIDEIKQALHVFKRKYQYVDAL